MFSVWDNNLKTYLLSKFLLSYDLPSCIPHFCSNGISLSALLTDCRCGTRSCHKQGSESRSLRTPPSFSHRSCWHLYPLCPCSPSTDIHGQKLGKRIIQMWMSLLASIPATTPFEWKQAIRRMEKNVIAQFASSHWVGSCRCRLSRYSFLGSYNQDFPNQDNTQGSCAPRQPDTNIYIYTKMQSRKLTDKKVNRPKKNIESYLMRK